MQRERGASDVGERREISVLREQIRSAEWFWGWKKMKGMDWHEGSAGVLLPRNYSLFFLHMESALTSLKKKASRETLCLTQLCDSIQTMESDPSFDGEEKSTAGAANNVVLLRRKRVKYTSAWNCLPPATWQLSALNRRAGRDSFTHIFSRYFLVH